MPKPTPIQTAKSKDKKDPKDLMTNEVANFLEAIFHHGDEEDNSDDCDTEPLSEEETEAELSDRVENMKLTSGKIADYLKTFGDSNGIICGYKLIEVQLKQTCRCCDDLGLTLKFELVDLKSNLDLLEIFSKKSIIDGSEYSFDPKVSEIVGPQIKIECEVYVKHKK